VIGTRWPQKPPVGTAIDWSRGLAQGLRAFYALNEGTGPYAADAARGGVALTWQEPAVSWGVGPRGVVGTFLDGVNYAATTGSPLSVGQPFSVAFRIYTSQASATSAGLVSIGATATNNQPLYLFQQSGSALRVLLGGIAYVTIIPSVVAGQWYTISSSWDGATEAHYVDGVLSYSGARSLGTVQTPPKLVVGAGYNSIGKGGIEWVGVWTRALTAPEHARLGGDLGAAWRIFAPQRDVIRSYSTTIGTGVSYPRGSSILRPVQLPTTDLTCYLD
jgi:hypothetical protein